MSAFTELLEFVGKLPETLQPEYRRLIDNYVSERDRLQNERIATSQANTGTFEVVATAGTAEQLLSNPLNSVEGC
jgi:DNA/RNA endonuclease YhcR with UshA esterase domain